MGWRQPRLWRAAASLVVFRGGTLASAGTSAFKKWHSGHTGNCGPAARAGVGGGGVGAWVADPADGVVRRGLRSFYDEILNASFWRHKFSELRHHVCGGKTHYSPPTPSTNPRPPGSSIPDPGRGLLSRVIGHCTAQLWAIRKTVRNIFLHLLDGSDHPAAARPSRPRDGPAWRRAPRRPGVCGPA